MDSNAKLGKTSESAVSASTPTSTSSVSSPSVRNLVRNFETKLSPTHTNTNTNTNRRDKGRDRDNQNQNKVGSYSVAKTKILQRQNAFTFLEGSSSTSPSPSPSSTERNKMEEKTNGKLIWNQVNDNTGTSSHDAEGGRDRDCNRDNDRDRGPPREHAHSHSHSQSRPLQHWNIHSKRHSCPGVFPSSSSSLSPLPSPSPMSIPMPSSPPLDIQNLKHQLKSIRTKFEYPIPTAATTRTSTATAADTTIIAKRTTRADEADKKGDNSITNTESTTTSTTTMQITRTNNRNNNNNHHHQQEQEEEQNRTYNDTRKASKGAAGPATVGPTPITTSGTCSAVDIMTQRKLLIVGLKKHLSAGKGKGTRDDDDDDDDDEGTNTEMDMGMDIVTTVVGEEKYRDGDGDKDNHGGEDENTKSGLRTNTYVFRKQGGNERLHSNADECTSPTRPINPTGILKCEDTNMEFNKCFNHHEEEGGNEKEEEGGYERITKDIASLQNWKNGDNYCNIPTTPNRRPGSMNYRDGNDDDGGSDNYSVVDGTEQFFRSIVRHCQSISSKFTPQRRTTKAKYKYSDSPNDANVEREQEQDRGMQGRGDDPEEGRCNPNHGEGTALDSKTMEGTTTSKRLRTSRHKKKVRVHKMRRIRKKWKDAWMACGVFASDTCRRISLSSKKSMRQARISGRKAGLRVRHSSSKAVASIQRSSSRAVMTIKDSSYRTMDVLQRIPQTMKMSAKCVVETTRQETALAYLSLLISMSCSIFPTVPRCNSGLCFMMFVHSSKGEQSKSFYQITIILVVLSTAIDIDWLISDYYPLTIAPNEERFIYNTQQTFLISRSIAWYMIIFGITAKIVTLASMLWNSVNGRDMIIHSWKAIHVFFPPTSTAVPDEIERAIDSRVIAVVWLEIICCLSLLLLALYAQMRLSWAPQFTTPFLFTSMIQIMYAKCIVGFLLVLGVLRSTTLSSLCSALDCCIKESGSPSRRRRSQKVLVDTSFLRFNGGLKALNLFIGVLLWVSLISALNIGGGETPKEVVIVTGTLIITLVISDILCVILSLVIIWYFGASKEGDREVDGKIIGMPPESYNLDRNVVQSQSLFENRMASAAAQPETFSELELDRVVACDPTDFSAQWHGLSRSIQMQYKVQRIPSIQECLDTFEYYRFHPIASGIIGRSATIKIFLLASSDNAGGIRCLIEVIIDPTNMTIGLQVKVTVPSAVHLFVEYLPLQELFGTLMEYPSVPTYR